MKMTKSQAQKTIGWRDSVAARLFAAELQRERAAVELHLGLQGGEDE